MTGLVIAPRFHDESTTDDINNSWENGAARDVSDRVLVFLSKQSVYLRLSRIRGGRVLVILQRVK